jgi:hypothetical protein
VGTEKSGVNLGVQLLFLGIYVFLGVREMNVCDCLFGRWVVSARRKSTICTAVAKRTSKLGEQRCSCRACYQGTQAVQQ